ncbi:hypothetical protein GCM10010172_06370 [Paractinoplanes ferrugineus]|uniref:Fibronectin type III domain protein n=1 Tax=Paractinoplanes ferrugineus TaxID=113564 RepID=A0A919J0E6_9ACTN|nr:cellulose binding domain-containing protein [Actinoplanes ferrugineus]GIE12446.1 hypothetical protein Afe05nite_42860 [Actinoplanes ferrugineus]
MTQHRPRTLAAATLFAAAVLAGATALMSGAPAGAAAAPLATTPTVSTSPAPPNPPADLHVAAVTTGSITLAWTAPTPTSAAIDGYNVSYTQAFNDIFWLKQIGAVTTVTITDGVRPSGQYSLRIATRDTLGHLSRSSDTIVVVTPASDTTADKSPPTAPGDLRVTGSSSTGVDLAWTAATDNVAVTGYKVYRFDGLFVSTLVGTTTATSITVPPVSSPVGNWYVRAVDAAGNLGFVSNFVTAPVVTTPPPVRACRVTYRPGNEWPGGFVAELSVTNLGTADINGWTLALTLGGDQRITGAWNATASQSGAVATLTAADWNKKITPGSSASFGMLGSWRTSNAPPTAAAVNGTPCELTTA